MSSARVSATLVLTILVSSISLSQPLHGQQKAATAANPNSNQKGTPAPAAPAKKGEGAAQVLQSVDGWPIHITYFASDAGKESPVVILLTSTEGPEKGNTRNRQIWQPTAMALQKSGFAVVTVDLRKHGDSVPAAPAGKEAPLKMNTGDYPLMVADLEAVKTFLLAEHAQEMLNVRKLGIVSMGSSSMVAAAFAVADWDKKPYPDGPTPATSTPRGQDVRALIAYSPNTSVKGINSTTVFKALRAIPFIAVHVIASKDDKDDFRNAEKYFKAVDPKDPALAEFRKLTPVPGTVRSERFLEGKLVDASTKDITDFLTRNLKEQDIPWVSRKSRLED